MASGSAPQGIKCVLACSACALGDLRLGAQVDGEAHQPAEAGSNGPTNVCVDFFLHASPLALKLRQLAERCDELVEKGILDVLSPFARLHAFTVQ